MKYTDTNSRGKFIVIYGANNIGKSTQTSMLVTRIIEQYHEQVLMIKYPIYGLQPTGPKIKAIIKGNPKTAPNVSNLELQKLYADNRKDFQDIVELALKAGVHVVAEDYIGTGLAWGLTKGAALKDLLELNNYLLIPDVSLLMDGKRFKTAIEKHHIFEKAGDDVWNKSKQVHLDLAKKFNWKIVKSDDTVDKVHEKIWAIVSKELKLK